MKDNILELIGNTPLVEWKRYEKKYGLLARVAGKLEGFNPGGSAKDRVGAAMIEEAEKEGKLSPGAVIIEPTSGNTGIGIALAARAKGYQAVLTMPETMSEERKNLLKAYGAKVVLTDGKKGMAGAIEEAKRLEKETPGSLILGQFENPANPRIHYLTTGPEIWRDTEGQVAAFVAGVGTGGTISGVGKYLKEKNPDIYIAAVEPAGSPVLSGGKPGPHGLQGIGAGFIPRVLDTSVYDEIIPVTDDQAYEGARNLSQTEGYLIGISGGAAMYAATLLAGRPRFQGKLIVVLLPDGGERYLSTRLYS